MYDKFLRMSVLGIAILILNSCSQDTDPSPSLDSYFIRFNVNGVKKEYKTFGYASIHYDEDNLIHQAEMLAGLTSDQSKEIMSFFLMDKNEFETGTSYEVKTAVEVGSPSAMMAQLKIVYLDKNGEPYTAIFPDLDLYDHLNVKDEGQLVFTEITKDHVKGTFSGKAFTEFPEREEIVFTQGEFVLERIN